jgi:glyoxylate reductase
MAQHDSVPVIAITRSVAGSLDVPGFVSDSVRVAMRGQPKAGREELLAFVKGAWVAVTMYSDKVDAEFLDAAGPQLKGVCNYAVGFENIDLELCKKRGVAVTNTPNAVTEGTADLAWLLIMATARRLIAADRYARSPAYPANGHLAMDEFLGLDLTGRTLLIVGAGRIGLGVAMRSMGWGMRVLYVSRGRHWEYELAPLAAERVSLEDGLRVADVVSVHTPLTPATRHMINASSLAIMKPSAILVNTARGPVVDEQALVDALKAGKLWGAGLDVYEREPVVHPELIAMENVVLTPHIGSAAHRYRRMMTEMVLANAAAILRGEEPPNRIR